MLSGYDSILYNNKLNNWNKQKKKRAATAKATNKSKGNQIIVEEVIWYNY